MGEVKELGLKIPEACCRITGTEEDFDHEDGAKLGLFHRCLTFRHTHTQIRCLPEVYPRVLRPDFDKLINH